MYIVGKGSIKQAGFEIGAEQLEAAFDKVFDYHVVSKRERVSKRELV